MRIFLILNSIFCKRKVYKNKVLEQCLSFYNKVLISFFFCVAMLFNLDRQNIAAKRMATSVIMQKLGKSCDEGLERKQHDSFCKEKRRAVRLYRLLYSN